MTRFTARFLLLLTLLYGCAPPPHAALPPPPMPPDATGNPGVVISQPRVPHQRIAGPVAQVFITLQGLGPDDHLVAASSPAAMRVVFHHEDADGMQQLEYIWVHKYEPTDMAGEFHLMLEGLRRPLHAGDRVPLSLKFRDAGVIDTVAVIR